MADNDSPENIVDTPEDRAVRQLIFKHFDLDGDGRISAGELEKSLQKLGSVTTDEVNRMMAEIDTDKDRHISFEEFTKFAQANRGLIKDVAKIYK